MNTGNERRPRSQAGGEWSDYVPLLVIVALTLLAACAKQYSYTDAWDWMTWMPDFMGTVLHVPPSTVALVEDLGMAVMAVTMLILDF